MRRAILIPTLSVALVWAVAAGALAATPGVTDNAHFFSAETVKTVDEQIQKLKNTYQKDVIVETFPSIPDNLKPQYTPENKNQFFANWFRDRAKELKVDGIYILICKEPGHLQVGASADVYRDGFSTTDRDTLRNTLLDRFRKKEYDAGLTDALHIVSNKFFEMSRTHATSARPSSGTATPAPIPASGSRGSSGSQGSSDGPSSWSWLVWLGIIAGAFIIIRLISAAFRGSAYPRGPGGYGPGYGGAPGYGGGGPGGGGFFSSLMGGLFGGVAGNWLGNRWFGGGREGMPPSAGPGAPPDGYSSSGGDFGSSDNGGGGDFGGGDAGGGDFGGGGGGGGGDFGGGDSGGGGGGGGDF